MEYRSYTTAAFARWARFYDYSVALAGGAAFGLQATGESSNFSTPARFEITRNLTVRFIGGLRAPAYPT